MVAMHSTAGKALICTAFSAVILLGAATPGLSQTIEVEEEAVLEDISNPPEDELVEDEIIDYRPLTQNSSVLSLQGGQRLMRDAINAVTRQDYSSARQNLQDARRLFNQISNFYQRLADNFVGIDGRVSASQRQRAVDAARLRDEATFQLALVHRASSEPELAVPLLVQVIGSQSPTSELGSQAYQQLFELGFVDVPFPSGGNS
ncbi:MAG: hypothetical protein AAGF24_07525 [Cyanobacteria bacterium P01_H01_bin.121]